MGKPSKQQLEEALSTAKQMRESGNDPHYVARTLLNLNYRVRYLEKVLEAAEYYLRGEDAHAHTVLEEAIERARAEDRHTAGLDDETMGL
jgi:hypothetical protein